MGFSVSIVSSGPLAYCATEAYGWTRWYQRKGLHTLTVTHQDLRERMAGGKILEPFGKQLNIRNKPQRATTFCASHHPWRARLTNQHDLLTNEPNANPYASEH
eukprot:189044-Amphidinium_carterae.2